MPQLLDQWGNPIDMTALKSERAGPTVTGVRSILSGHPARNLTPQRLASLLLQSEEGNATAYLELAEDMEEKDWHFASVLGTRKRAVAQLDITVQAGGDSEAEEQQAEFIRDWLTRDELEDEIIDILDAIGKGYSVIEIMWETTAKSWFPKRLVWRDPRWFEFDQETGETISLRTETGTEPLDPFKFIVHASKTKSGSIIRGGASRLAAWAYLFKNYSVKDWVTFIEVYGQPIRVGRYHSGATDEQKDLLLRAVSMIGTDAAAIIPDTMKLEFIDAKLQGNGSEIYEKFCDWIDRQVSKALLGQTLTTEVKGGSMAAAKVHDEVRKDIMRADARQLAATLNRDLIRPMVDLNFGTQETYPRIRIELPDSIDMKETAEAFGQLVDRGLEVPQAYVLERFGIPAAVDGEKLLAPNAKPAAPAPAEPPEPPAPPPPPAPQSLAISAEGDPTDSLDDLVAAELAEWEPIMDELAEPIRELVDKAESLEEIHAGLVGMFQDMPAERFRELLARMGFSARVAGAVEADIGGQD